MTKKKQVGVRFDSNRTRLKTGETQRPNGTYAYRWSTPDGKRHSIYAPTLEKLREQEEQIIVDKHDGIRSDVKSITVNEMFDLWCQLKRSNIPYPRKSSGYGWLVSLDRSIYIMYSPRRGIYGTTRSPGRNSYDRSAAFA